MDAHVYEEALLVWQATRSAWKDALRRKVMRDVIRRSGLVCCAYRLIVDGWNRQEGSDVSSCIRASMHGRCALPQVTAA